MLPGASILSLRSRFVELLGGGLETSVVSMYGSKLGVSEGYVYRTLVGLSVWDAGVAVLGQ